MHPWRSKSYEIIFWLVVSFFPFPSCCWGEFCIVLPRCLFSVPKEWLARQDSTVLRVGQAGPTGHRQGVGRKDLAHDGLDASFF